MAAHRRFTSEEIIEAYKATGSVWKAAKQIGCSGQSVWERLKHLDYKITGRMWTNEELQELKILANTCSISEICRRLGRPYAAVACKLSEQSIRISKQKPVKIPRGVGLDKASIVKHKKALELFKGTFTHYCRLNSLNIDSLVYAIQNNDLAWWDEYSKNHSKIAQSICAYCERVYYPMTKKQKSCSKKCQAHRRSDETYFGGNRKKTVGLSEKICQMCDREVHKGLSSHHVYGKENDPGNDYLVALCSGCHNLVTQLSGRGFKATEEAWETLINYVMLRKSNGKSPGYFTTVEIEEYDGDEE